jgi:hypothetical protein
MQHSYVLPLGLSLALLLLLGCVGGVHSAPYVTEYGPWGECSHPCGDEGTQTRSMAGGLPHSHSHTSNTQAAHNPPPPVSFVWGVCE